MQIDGDEDLNNKKADKNKKKNNKCVSQDKVKENEESKWYSFLFKKKKKVVENKDETRQTLNVKPIENNDKNNSEKNVKKIQKETKIENKENTENTKNKKNKDNKENKETKKEENLENNEQNENNLSNKPSGSSKFLTFHRKQRSCVFQDNISEKLLDEKKEKDEKPIQLSLPESFPDSENYQNYISEHEKENKKFIDNRECFCEGFFIASFPQKEGKVIEDSQTFPSSCGHSECSNLPAMQPEIIMRYPLEDTKTLELNNLAATICFPTGIKVCYSDPDLNEPADIKDYVTSITNQKGDRYYMMTYHFYYRIPNDKYINLYEVNPLKYYSQKYLDAVSYLSEEEYINKEKEIQDKVDESEKLISMESVCVPFCICLISKYPYVEEMKKCLQAIYELLLKNPTKKKEDINNLIMYLIHSVPIPKKSDLVKFYIPYYSEGITLSCPKVKDIISIMNTNISDLFQYFSIDNILLIFRLILSEQKILFFDDDYTRLSNVIDSFLTLLYPFQWTHTCIPIMSDQMLKYLQTFLPFINGINSSLVDYVKDVFSEAEGMESDEVFIININKNKNVSKEIITYSSSLINKKTNFEKYIQDNVPTLPFQLERELRSKLKILENEINKYNRKIKNNNIDKEKSRNYLNELEFNLRNAFLEMFIQMFHNYYRYTVNMCDDDNVFNQSLFINNFEEKDQKFFNEFFDTQLFQLFKQNCAKDELSYFKAKIIEFNKKESIDRESVYSANSDYNGFLNKDFNTSKLYIIKPEYLNINENNCEKISEELKKLFENDTKIDEKKEKDPRILESFEQIEDKNYNNSNCIIYILPEEKSIKKVISEKKTLEEDLPKNAIYMRIKNLSKNSEVLKNDNRYKEKFDEKEKDSIKETINEFCRKLFEGQEIEEDQKQKKDLQNTVNSFAGRQCFIDLLLKQNLDNIVLLNEKSFNLLGNLIYNSLLFILKIPETSKIIEHMVCLIKITKIFGKEIKEKEKNGIITIFEEYKYKFRGYAKVSQMNFWQKWYDIDIKNESNATDEIKEQLILRICDVMFELELSKSFIKNTLQKIIEKLFGKESKRFSELIGKIIDKIKKAQYIGSVSKNNPKFKK